MLRIILFVSQFWLLASSSSVFPLANGFPNPNSSQLLAIEEHSLGTLPTSGLPSRISPQGITNFQIIALNELVEVAFFTELLWNISNNVNGYDIQPDNLLLSSLVAAQSQEELHALNANAALQHFGAQPILPCSYSFPVTCFDDALHFASVFTSFVTGTLQDIIQVFAENGDSQLAGGLASVLGPEGEQEGFYRFLQGKIPNELPFLTPGTREFLFSALHQVISTESCPSLKIIDLPVFAPLDLLTSPAAETTNLTFTFDNTMGEQLTVVYINQQNTPIVKPMQILSSAGTVVTAGAEFPYDEYQMNGLTIMALANETGPFADARAVAKSTVFGPAFILL